MNLPFRDWPGLLLFTFPVSIVLRAVVRIDNIRDNPNPNASN
jgi:hypothetical protein